MLILKLKKSMNKQKKGDLINLKNSPFAAIQLKNAARIAPWLGSIEKVLEYFIPACIPLLHSIISIYN